MSGPDRPELLDDRLVPPLDGGGESMDGAVVEAPCSPTLSSIQSTIFGVACATAGCHVGKSAAAALDLTRADLSTLLVGRSASSCAGQTLVVPGKPEASLLLTKLNGHLPSGCGDPMPPAGPPLSAQRLACVSSWITSLSASDAGVGGDAGSCQTCGTSSCLDLSRDTQHCGACGVMCPASASCVQGACQCPAGLRACGDACIDITSNPSHCQGCNIKCASNQLCTPSGCSSTASCGALTQCGSACVDTTSSVSHCGACNMACASGQSCQAGTCVCPNGGKLCGGSCVDTTSNTSHCGACGVVCGAGKACVQGSCACAGGPVSFSQVAPILNDNCTNSGCHAGVMPKEALNLTSAKAYAELVNVRASQCSDGRLLVPTSGTGKSYLLQKLRGEDMCSGSKMPKADTTLPSQELSLIEAWICNGAAP